MYILKALEIGISADYLIDFVDVVFCFVVKVIAGDKMALLLLF